MAITLPVFAQMCYLSDLLWFFSITDLNNLSISVHLNQVNVFCKVYLTMPHVIGTI